MTPIDIEQEKRMDKTKKIMLFFAMGSIIMIFAGLTSAYVVSKSRPDWLTDFNLPSSFLYSTITIIISSITFILARRELKTNNRFKTGIYLILTLLLGGLFVVLQFRGFGQIIDTGYFFTGSESNITTSFLYVIVIAHIAHIFAGLLAIIVVIYNNFKHKYSSTKTLGIELCEMFWHFLGFIWLYLYIFFIFYK